MTSRTKAIIPVHLFGQCADMDRVMAVADRHGLPVIEDAAQSLGSDYKGRKAGNFGAFGVFSLFPSKNLGGFGDGGVLVTNDDELADRPEMLRAHGAKPKYFHKYVGGNFRLDPLQAALVAVKLPHYEDYTAQPRRQRRVVRPIARSAGGGLPRSGAPIRAAEPESMRSRSPRRETLASSCPARTRTTATSGTSTPSGSSGKVAGTRSAGC